MEDWQLDFEWLKVRHYVKDNFGRKELPDLNGVLFLIGIQEYGRIKEPFSKEEKQDLMHIAVCRLLAYDNYYRFVGRDEEGWPHYELVRKLAGVDLKAQAILLKEKTIQYFKELDDEFLNQETGSNSN